MNVAVDRYATFRKELRGFGDEESIIIADRYTTSNMVHQGSKFADIDKREEYLNWLWDLEFNKFELPIPDCVIFLDMPPEESKRLMKGRKNKFTGESEKDIHEKDYDHLLKSYNNACWVADKYNWHKINCVKNGDLKSIQEIHEEIYKIVKRNL